MAIGTPSLLPLYVPFENLEKFGIWPGPPPTFWDNVPHFCFFLRHPLAYSCIFYVILRKFEVQSKQDIKKPFAGTLLK